MDAHSSAGALPYAFKDSFPNAYAIIDASEILLRRLQTCLCILQHKVNTNITTLQSF